VITALDEVLKNATDSESPMAGILGYAPGAVLSVQAPEWHYAKSVGTADPETGAPLDCEMPFQIGSNTKMMTASVLLQLVEEDVLSLGDPLAEYLPDIAAALPFGDAITLRHLARHTSGVFSYTDNAPDGTPGIMEGAIADPAALRRGYQPTEMIDFVIAHGQPGFAPGAEGEWAYSNTGYVLLGLVIEKLEEKPLGKVFETRIFGPLGMDETFLWDDVPQLDFGLPRAYLKAPFDVETTDWNMSQGWAAGGVISTIGDMHSFIAGLLSGNLFKNADTLGLMQETLPNLSLYGIGLSEKEPGLWGHGGQTLGFVSDVAAFGGNGISIVAWANSSENIMGAGARATAQALRQAGVIEDPADAATEVLRSELDGTAWQLVSIETDGTAETIDAPERYELRFVDSESLAIGADCNRVNANWALHKLTLSIGLGPSTKAACPPDSKQDAYLAALDNSSSAVMIDDTLLLNSVGSNAFVVLTFTRAK